MAVYINQINKRRAAEQAAMAEVDEKTTRRLGLQEKKRVVPQNDESALRQVLEALGITDYELEDDDMLSPEEQLTGILRPRGIMMRDIRLTGEWWRECVGPLLGYAKDGRLVALTPTKTGLGYQYREQDGTIRQVGKREMADELKPTAITFTKALPLKPLKVKDGFTADQRFFIAYAGVWGQNITEQEIRQRVKNDPHSLGEWRVNGALPHIDMWYEAFGVKPGDKMYLPKEQRLDLW